jgi:hypothetical protein
MSLRDFAFTSVGLVTSALVFAGLQLGGLVPQPVRTLHPHDPARDPAHASASATSADPAPSATPPVSDDEAWRTANANLAETVRRTQQLLDKNVAEKKKLQTELEAAKAKLVAAEGDAALPRNPFDLSQDDWKELAKKGAVRARFPCGFDPDAHIGPEKAVALGLAPTDAPAIDAAFKHEEDRIAAAITPACGKVLQSADLAQRLGPSTCLAVLQRSVKDTHADLQLVADIRAGNKPMPSPDQLDPFATMLLAETASTKALETELAKSFGPEVAHAITFSDELGSCSGSYDDKPPPHP